MKSMNTISILLTLATILEGTVVLRKDHEENVIPNAIAGLQNSPTTANSQKQILSRTDQADIFEAEDEAFLGYRVKRRARYGGTGSKADLNNHANQMNPNNPAYYSSRGGTGFQADMNNHLNQMNPNNPPYYSSR